MAGARVPAGSSHDTGAVVVGWFARIAITVALLGTLAFDGVSIAVARAHVNDIASDAADAAASRYVLQFSPTQALQAAQTSAASEGGTVTAKDVTVVRRLGTHDVIVTVTVHYVPGTALLGHLPGTGDLGQTTATASRTVKQ
jgi:hypothetical protein